jgi:hypothetical protein
MLQSIVSDVTILGEVERGERGEVLYVLHPHICDPTPTQL